MASLSLKHINKTYPNGYEAVKDFNLEIEDKEFIIFVGPSGCGKSTTLRMIAGLEDITGGELYIGDTKMNDVDPKVFLMDEPLSNLDAKLRGQMRVEISRLHQRLGTTIIYVTHDQTEAMTLGTRIVVMNGGIVQQVDTPQVLYDKPNNLFVAGFIGSPQMNFVDALCCVEGDGVILSLQDADIRLPKDKAKKLIDGGYDGKRVVLGIRPEDIHDDPEYLAAHRDTVITAKIRVYEMLGAEVFLYFDYDGANMTARVKPDTKARTNDMIDFALDPEKIHVFDKETELTITN